MAQLVTVQRCPVCADLTPHSRRTVATGPFFAGALVLGAGLLLLRDLDWAPVSLLLVLAAVVAFQIDRRRLWRIHCERCRGKLLMRTRGKFVARTRGRPFWFDRHTLYGR